MEKCGCTRRPGEMSPGSPEMAVISWNRRKACSRVATKGWGDSRRWRRFWAGSRRSCPSGDLRGTDSSGWNEPRIVRILRMEDMKDSLDSPDSRFFSRSSGKWLGLALRGRDRIPCGPAGAGHRYPRNAIFSTDNHQIFTRITPRIRNRRIIPAAPRRTVWKTVPTTPIHQDGTNRESYEFCEWRIRKIRWIRRIRGSDSVALDAAECWKPFAESK